MFPIIASRISTGRIRAVTLVRIFTTGRIILAVAIASVAVTLRVWFCGHIVASIIASMFTAVISFVIHVVTVDDRTFEKSFIYVVENETSKICFSSFLSFYILTCTFMIFLFSYFRTLLGMLVRLVGKTSFAVSKVFLKSVLVSILLVESVKRLVSVVTLAIGFLQVALLALCVTTVRLVVATLVRFA